MCYPLRTFLNHALIGDSNSCVILLQSPGSGFEALDNIVVLCPPAYSLRFSIIKKGPQNADIEVPFHFERRESRS